jgi:hypothetical protein
MASVVSGTDRRRRLQIRTHYELTGMLAPKGSAVGGEGADNEANRPRFVDWVFVFERMSTWLPRSRLRPQGAVS